MFKIVVLPEACRIAHVFASRFKKLNLSDYGDRFIGTDDLTELVGSGSNEPENAMNMIWHHYKRIEQLRNKPGS
jgi:hypothetical protein